MKYIIDVPNQDYSYDEMLHTLKLKFYDDNLSCEVILDAEPYTEPDRECIEDEVWEFLEFLFTGMSAEERYKCFDNVFVHIIVSTMSYQEAKAKYEAWLKKKDETFDIGDEVYDKEIDSIAWRWMIDVLEIYNSHTRDRYVGGSVCIITRDMTGKSFMLRFALS